MIIIERLGPERLRLARETPYPEVELHKREQRCHWPESGLYRGLGAAAERAEAGQRGSKDDHSKVEGGLQASLLQGCEVLSGHLGALHGHAIQGCSCPTVSNR